MDRSATSHHWHPMESNVEICFLEAAVFERDVGLQTSFQRQARADASGPMLASAPMWNILFENPHTFFRTDGLHQNFGSFCQ
mmetsp:Transcript_11059/g.23448  ORF Transcript_11059/g.23448 Transcript_11059/m.23448 type:complete len:82 (+) Transcript_11059:2068-2313(+)